MCDAGSNNGRPGFACTTSCTIGSTNPGGSGNGIHVTTTNPGSHGTLSIGEYRVIVGNGTRVFSDADVLSFRSSYPILITGKDTYVTNASPIISGGDVSRVISEPELCVGPRAMQIGVSRLVEDTCSMVGRPPVEECTYKTVWDYHDVPCRPSYVLWNGTQLRNFKGRTAPLSASESYRDVAPGEFLVGIRFLQEDLKVRVSKPAVSNTTGGNAYLARATGYDVNAIASSFLENLRNGNFTTTATVSTNLGTDRNPSSATATSVREVASPRGQAGSLNAVRSANSEDLFAYSEADFDGLPKFGDDERVRVVANGTVTINSPSGSFGLGGVRTIVIENGTLRIESDMAYSNADASYAFIVKNGTIDIDPSVTKIAGVFLVMNGSFSGGDSAERLAVDGNLYGNVSSLVDARTYVRGTTFSSALTTGVTINYSSRALRNPPPLLTQFVEQYSIGRVAR